MKQAIVIFIDSPFHKECAKNIIGLYPNSWVLIYHVRSGLGAIDGCLNIVNSKQYWSALNFVEKGLQGLAEELKGYGTTVLYTFYETSYHFLYVKSALRIDWKDVILYDDGIGSCFRHAMPSRNRLLLQKIVLKILYNIKVPYSRYSLGNNRYVENVITYWPSLVSRHSGVSVSTLVSSYEKVDVSLSCDFVFLLGPVLAKGRMTECKLIDYIERALSNIIGPSDKVLVKPHPREDIVRLTKTLDSTSYSSQFVLLRNEELAFENYFASLKPKGWIGMPSTVLLNRIQYNEQHGLKEEFYFVEEPNDKYPQRGRLLKKLLDEKNFI